MPFKKRSSEAVAGNSDVEQMTPAKKARNNSGSVSGGCFHCHYTGDVYSEADGKSVVRFAS